MNWRLNGSPTFFFVFAITPQQAGQAKFDYFNSICLETILLVNKLQLNSEFIHPFMQIWRPSFCPEK